MRIADTMVLLCGLSQLAWADEPAPGSPAPDEPAPSAPMRQLADNLETLADIADRVGLDTASHEATRLARAARVASDYVDLAVRMAAANAPTSLSRYWSVTLGAGARRGPERGAAGELSVAAGLAVGGPSCTLLEIGGRASITHDGPTVAQSGRVCLGAVPIEPEEAGGADADILAVNAYEALGLNVRPAVEAAAVLDSRRFAIAEAGISVEGVRWYGSRRRWSVALLNVALSQSYLVRRVEDDYESLARVTAAAWFAELRYRRDRGDLTDFALRLFPIAVDTIEAGDAVGTASLVPAELIGLGSHGVYVDAAGGVELTTDEASDTADVEDERPDVGLGVWRLALRLGVPRAHASITNRQRLMPTFNVSTVVAETRTSAALHVDAGPLFLDAEAYRARLRVFTGRGGAVDHDLDTWGVRGEAWLRAGEQLLFGASWEVGRAFVFGEPSPAIERPPFGHLVLAHVGWRQGSTRGLD